MIGLNSNADMISFIGVPLEIHTRDTVVDNLHDKVHACTVWGSVVKFMFCKHTRGLCHVCLSGAPWMHEK